VIKLNLYLADQLVAPHFLISLLILVIVWALSGPLTATVVTLLSAVVVAYLALSSREPSMFLQVVIYAALFTFMVFYLYERQRKNNDKRIAKEKIMEELNLVREESGKKEQLGRALERKIDRFLDLQRFAEGLKSERDLAGAAQKIVHEAQAVLSQSDECALYLVNESEQELALVASTRRGGEVVREKEGSVFDQWVMKRYRAIVIEDATNDFRFATDARQDGAALRSLCASPLMTGNKVLGVLRAGSREPKRFNSDDLRLLNIISNLGAVILRNLLLYDKMKELAQTDSLTGLYLNRYFQGRLGEELARAQLSGAAFSLILLDIDFFKRYNDEYGHSAGDLVLKNIAVILSRCASSVDVVARYGGEEFVLLLPGKNKSEAMRVAERIRGEIQKNKFTLRRIESRVTASLGVASFPEDGRSREELIRLVDKNLYQAKHDGRNLVCGNI